MRPCSSMRIIAKPHCKSREPPSGQWRRGLLPRTLDTRSLDWRHDLLLLFLITLKDECSSGKRLEGGLEELKRRIKVFRICKSLYVPCVYLTFIFLWILNRMDIIPVIFIFVYTDVSHFAIQFSLYTEDGRKSASFGKDIDVDYFYCVRTLHAEGFHKYQLFFLGNALGIFRIEQARKRNLEGKRRSKTPVTWRLAGV